MSDQAALVNPTYVTLRKEGEEDQTLVAVTGTVFGPQRRQIAALKADGWSEIPTSQEEIDKYEGLIDLYRTGKWTLRITDEESAELSVLKSTDSYKKLEALPLATNLGERTMEGATKSVIVGGVDGTDYYIYCWTFEDGTRSKLVEGL